MVSGDMANEAPIHPPVTWAQRNDLIFLTVYIDDVKNLEVKVEGNKLHVKGAGGPEKKIYEADIELYKEINPETSKQLASGRGIDFVLMKTEAGPYWPRLLKDGRKCHWLKVDFHRWRDEDESDEEGAGDAGPGGPGGAGGMDIEAMMKQMGGLGGGGMPDLGGMGGMEGDDKEEEEDSDDGDLPDLEA